MKRVVAVSLVVILVGALVGVSFWGLSAKDRAEERIDAAQAKARELSESLETSRDETEKVSESLQKKDENLKHQRGRLEDLQNGKSGLRISLARLRGLRFAMIPDGAHLRSTHVAGGRHPNLVVTSWWIGEEYYPRTSGAYAWIPTRGSAAGKSTVADWRLAFGLTLHRNDGLSIGSPGAEGHAANASAVGATYATANDVGDVTGDGLPDLLTSEGNNGSGGCAVWRVFENRGDGFEQIFRRQHCEHLIDIADGQLRIDSAIYPKDCESIHGCGTRRTWLRWDGAEWNKVRSRITSRD